MSESALHLKLDRILAVSISVQYFPGNGVRPCGWTKSSWRFDRLPGVLILELRRAEVA